MTTLLAIIRSLDINIFVAGFHSDIEKLIHCEYLRQEGPPQHREHCIKCFDRFKIARRAI